MNKSTLINLLSFKKFFLNSCAGNRQTDALCTEFENTFDKLDHQLFIKKFKKIDFADPLLSWFYSFLTQRSQINKYKNFLSTPISVISGVPQGDHVSLLIFSLFIYYIVFSI